MQRSRVLPLGGNIESWAESWQIASIRVDNPSGAWLQVLPLDEYVPPYVSGWVRTFSPTTLNLSVLSAIASPSGSLSQFVGNPATVTIYDVPQGISEGTPSPTGSGARVTTIPPSLHAIAPSIGTGVSSTLISMLTEPTRHIVVRRLETVPDLTAGFAGPEPFRSLITVRFQPAGGGAGTPEWYLSISPETPFAEASFEDGTFILGAGQDLEITGFAEQGAAKGYYIAMAQYYLEGD